MISRHKDSKTQRHKVRSLRLCVFNYLALSETSCIFLMDLLAVKNAAMLPIIAIVMKTNIISVNCNATG